MQSRTRAQHIWSYCPHQPGAWCNQLGILATHRRHFHGQITASCIWLVLFCVGVIVLRWTISTWHLSTVDINVARSNDTIFWIPSSSNVSYLEWPRLDLHQITVQLSCWIFCGKGSHRRETMIDMLFDIVIFFCLLQVHASRSSLRRHYPAFFCSPVSCLILDSPSSNLAQ